jgi:hypothetical protein
MVDGEVRRGVVADQLDGELGMLDRLLAQRQAIERGRQDRVRPCRHKALAALDRPRQDGARLPRRAVQVVRAAVPVRSDELGAVRGGLVAGRERRRPKPRGALGNAGELE